MAKADEIEVEAEMHVADEDDDVTSPDKEIEETSRRSRKMTSKGLEYILSMKMKLLERASKGLERMMDVIMEGIDTDADVHELGDNRPVPKY